MSWNSANIDLIAERNDLDAFLAKCLELRPADTGDGPREDVPEEARPQDVADGEAAAEHAGETACVSVETVQSLNEETAGVDRPAVEEAPVVPADPAEVPEEKTHAAEAAEPAVASPAVEKEDVSEEAPEAWEQKFETPVRDEPDADPQPETAIPAADLRADEEFGQQQPRWAGEEIAIEKPEQPAPHDTVTAVWQDAEAAPEPATETVDRIVPQDKSALRKPSRNVAAIAYKKKKEKKTKFFLIALYIIIAVVLGVEAFLYLFPTTGYRTADMVGRRMNIISTSGDAKNIKDAGTEGRQQVNKRINQDGNNETK
jgi:hypothetical protein